MKRSHLINMRLQVTLSTSVKDYVHLFSRGSNYTLVCESDGQILKNLVEEFAFHIYVSLFSYYPSQYFAPN